LALFFDVEEIKNTWHEIIFYLIEGETVQDLRDRLNRVQLNVQVLVVQELDQGGHVDVAEARILDNSFPVLLEVLLEKYAAVSPDLVIVVSANALDASEEFLVSVEPSLADVEGDPEYKAIAALPLGKWVLEPRYFLNDLGHVLCHELDVYPADHGIEHFDPRFQQLRVFGIIIVNHYLHCSLAHFFLVSLADQI
jgi:hypothetical protein